MKFFKYSILVEFIIFRLSGLKAILPYKSRHSPLSRNFSEGKLCDANACSKKWRTYNIIKGRTNRSFPIWFILWICNLIGDDSLIWYPKPEASLKYRLIDETESFPGMSIGIDTQGHGQFHRQIH
ncbi:MAG: hypothetical protein CM1200mP1_02430 [Candidatus Neomarinimicrobiota bacterium]|nr:MAG: hypothetical protein CM1200mP1_02430 [Candidatus Neomarinimicrobiota bacterium]